MNDRVTSGIEDALVPIVPPHEKVLSPWSAKHLQDLPGSFDLADLMAGDHDDVTLTSAALRDDLSGHFPPPSVATRPSSLRGAPVASG
jgi:hypothetical protein